MTKFEEDLNKKMDLKEVPMYFTQSGCSMTRKTYIETNWIFDNYKNWHSDEEFQEMKESYWNQAESILSMLDEIKSLKSQLQQQALPVVPDFIGKLINTFGAPEDGKYINYSASYLENQKELDWIDNHQKTWLTALLIGFTVEKPQLFYLKNKLTGMWLMRDEVDEVYPYDHTFNRCRRGKFTQQEIDSMQTGSYELVPVEDGE